MKRIILTLSLITVMCSAGLAQTTSSSIGAAISSILNVTTDGTPTLAGFTTEAAITAGVVSAPVAFTVTTNRLWTLSTSITSIGATPLAAGSGPQTITNPLLPTHIAYGVGNAAVAPATYTAFAALTTTFPAKTGNRGAPDVTGNTFNLRYKVTPGLLVDPGTYAVLVTYTVSAN